MRVECREVCGRVWDRIRRVRGRCHGTPARVSGPTDESPTPERCLEAYYLRRTRFELIAERKVRRRQLTDDGNVEITGRDLREREHRAPAGQMAFEWIAR